MFNFHYDAHGNSTKSTCHSSGVRGHARASLSISISLLTELWVWRAVAFVEWATSVQKSVAMKIVARKSGFTCACNFSCSHIFKACAGAAEVVHSTKRKGRRSSKRFTRIFTMTTGDRAMPKDVRISIQLESRLRDEAEAVLRTAGVSLSEAVRIFLRQVVLQKGLPTEVSIPNQETIDALQQTKRDKNGLKTYDSPQELLKRWTSGDAPATSKRILF